jgi:hypothetical protein
MKVCPARAMATRRIAAASARRCWLIADGWAVIGCGFRNVRLGLRHIR